MQSDESHHHTYRACSDPKESTDRQLRFQKDCSDSPTGVTEMAMFYKYIRPCTCRCMHICICRRTHISIRRKNHTHVHIHVKYSSSIKTFTPMLMPTSHRSRQVKKCPQVHANSKGLYQSAHPRSPMRVFAIRTEHAVIPRNQQTDN